MPSAEMLSGDHDHGGPVAGPFLDALKENGLYEDTLVILTTDHGHMLGEHGFTGKNYMHAYNEMAHIPLFVKMPHGECAGEHRNS